MPYKKKKYFFLRQIFTNVLAWNCNQNIFCFFRLLKVLPCANWDFSKFQCVLLLEITSLFYLNMLKTVVSQTAVLYKPWFIKMLFNQPTAFGYMCANGGSQ